MAKRQKAKWLVYFEYATAQTILFVLSLLPRRGALALGKAVAWIGFHTLGKLRRTGLRNLEIAFPKLSESQRLDILKGSLQSLGRVLGEVSQFGKATSESLRKIIDFELDDESQLLYKRIREENRGLVITTGHLGNWELLVFAFAALHEPIAYLARPLDNPLIEELTVKIRTRFGNRPINKANSAMLVIKMLREGDIVGILSDVNAHPKEGIFVPFFSLSSCTTAGPATFAIRTDSLIFPMFCVYDHEQKKYKVVHGPVIEPSMTGDRSADILTTTAAYTAEIEKIIREYPDQWLWIHKRWKTRPPGEPEVY